MFWSIIQKKKSKIKILNKESITQEVEEVAMDIEKDRDITMELLNKKLSDWNKSPVVRSGLYERITRAPDEISASDPGSVVEEAQLSDPVSVTEGDQSPDPDSVTEGAPSHVTSHHPSKHRGHHHTRHRTREELRIEEYVSKDDKIYKIVTDKGKIKRGDRIRSHEAKLIPSEKIYRYDEYRALQQRSRGGRSSSRSKKTRSRSMKKQTKKSKSHKKRTTKKR